MVPLYICRIVRIHDTLEIVCPVVLTWTELARWACAVARCHFRHWYRHRARRWWRRQWVTRRLRHGDLCLCSYCAPRPGTPIAVATPAAVTMVTQRDLAEAYRLSNVYREMEELAGIQPVALAVPDDGFETPAVRDYVHRVTVYERERQRRLEAWKLEQAATDR